MDDYQGCNYLVTILIWIVRFHGIVIQMKFINKSHMETVSFGICLHVGKRGVTGSLSTGHGVYCVTRRWLPATVGYNTTLWITFPLLGPQVQIAVLPGGDMDSCFQIAV